MPLSLLVVLQAGLPMQLACGTSLLLIVVDALVALGHWPQQSLPLMLPLLLVPAVGAALGQRLAPRLRERRCALPGCFLVSAQSLRAC